MTGILADDFRTKLVRVIARIESRSRAELVVVIKPRAGRYAEFPLGAGTALAFVALTCFRFFPIWFDEWLIYAGTVAAFLIGAAVTAAVPSVLRLAAGGKRLARESEVLARASFQKGKIHHTRDKTGVLIFLALFERQALILPDSGVESAMPWEEWQKICEDLQSIFAAKNPAEALLEQLEKLQVAFGRYLPQVGADINELPDHLEIDL